VQRPLHRHWIALGALAAATVGSALGAQAASGATGSAGAMAGAKAARARQAFVSALEGQQTAERVSRTGGGAMRYSSNWSGYADDNTTGRTYTAVKGSWIEPTATCNSMEDQFAVFWVGLDGWNSSTVEQDGTATQCYEGTLYQYTWWEMYPANEIQAVASSVQPGDHITASVTFSSGAYHLKVTDATHTANSFTVTETCGSGLTCGNASAEWVAEAPGGSRGEFPLEQYTAWKVTGASATSAGTAGSISAFPDDQIGMLDSGGNYLLASAGKLNSTGTSFTDTWHDSY
jgi:hypothetical protein